MSGGIHFGDQPEDGEEINGQEEAPQQRRVIRGGAPRATGQRQAEPRAAVDRTEHDAAAVTIAQPHEDGKARPPRDEYGYYDEGPVRRSPISEQEVGQFDIPKKLRKQGWDYGWWPITVTGEPVDASFMMQIRQGGWRPAKAKFFQDLVLPGTADDAAVTRMGQQLFIRPMQMSVEARQEQVRKANEALKSRTQASQEGRLIDGGQEGLSDMGRVVQPVNLGLTIEGEYGTYDR